MLEWLCCLQDTEHTRRHTLSVAHTLGPNHTLSHTHRARPWVCTHTLWPLVIPSDSYTPPPVHPPSTPSGSLVYTPRHSYALTPAIPYHSPLNSTILPDHNTHSCPALACWCLFTPVHHGVRHVAPDPGVGCHTCAHTSSHTLCFLACCPPSIHSQPKCAHTPVHLGMDRWMDGLGAVSGRSGYHPLLGFSSPAPGKKLYCSEGTRR